MRFIRSVSNYLYISKRVVIPGRACSVVSVEIKTAVR